MIRKKKKVKSRSFWAARDFSELGSFRTIWARKPERNLGDIDFEPGKRCILYFGNRKTSGAQPILMEFDGAVLSSKRGKSVVFLNEEHKKVLDRVFPKSLKPGECRRIRCRLPKWVIDLDNEEECRGYGIKRRYGKITVEKLNRWVICFQEMDKCGMEVTSLRSTLKKLFEILDQKKKEK